MLGGIEAGGTKFVCAVGTGPHDLIVSAPISTTTPAETFAQVITFFKEHAPIEAIGIGSFGPIDLRPDSPTFGYITSTPKPGWGNTRFAGIIQDAVNVPIYFDTDVNVAALGEHRWGAAQGLNTFVYLTIGTGIGGGGMVDSKLLHGLIHPEIGHLILPRDKAMDPYEGHCPFHEDCLEGLACGPAIEARWHKKASELPPDHPAWSLEAHYLSVGLVDLIYTLSPERFVMGGGVMHQAHLFPMIRENVKRRMNGYQMATIPGGDFDRYIVPPSLGDRSGVLGALALAQRASD